MVKHEQNRYKSNSGVFIEKKMKVCLKVVVKIFYSGVFQAYKYHHPVTPSFKSLVMSCQVNDNGDKIPKCSIAYNTIL